MKTCPNCYVQYTAVTHKPYVTLCALHAAAEEMLERLGIAATLLEDIGTIMEERFINPGAPWGEARRIRVLIANARPQEPADDSEMPLGPIKAPARGLES